MAAFRRLGRGQVILAKQFQDPLIMGDDYQRRLLLSKVLTNANEGEDMSHLLPTIVKFLAHPDMCVKKLASEIVIQHHKDTSELVLLALNTLIQDSVESNPIIRLLRGVLLYSAAIKLSLKD